MGSLVRESTTLTFMLLILPANMFSLNMNTCALAKVQVIIVSIMAVNSLFIAVLVYNRDAEQSLVAQVKK